MPFFELFDETLDINSTENYELLIQVSPDEFSFCTLDTIRNKYILIRSFTPDNNKYFNAEQISEIIHKDDFLTKKYKKVRIVMPSPKFTLVPAPLFDPGRKDDYFTFNHVASESFVILNNKLSKPDSFLVFAVSKQMIDLINNAYHGVHPYHHIKPLIDHISHSGKSAVDNYIHVHVERDFFNLIIYGHNTLKFSNTFTYRNISDILYYILNVLKSMDIKQEETIYLSGQTERYDDLYSNLSLYIRNVKFAEPAGSFTFSYVFNDTDLHRYINLFSIASCE
jgi:hypothetical protein